MPPDSVPEPSSMDVARLLLAALQTRGVRDVVICPGSRSAPLAYALAEAEASGTIRLHVRIDERVAGFTALGLSLASGAPVPVVTTSGTAVGELLPAVMEANHVGARVLVLSADRPAELQGTGANQTTNQVDLFGAHVRKSVDIPAGANPESAVAAALAAAQGSASAAPGPVQVNVAFRDPLVPAPGDKLPPPGAKAPTPPQPPAPAPAPAWQADPAARTLRTVVVAGHGAGPEASEFAHALGLPLFAEPSSNARFGPHAIGPYRTLLASHGPRIQRVVLFGRPTLSRPVATLLAAPGIATALWHPSPAPWFEAGKRRERLVGDPAGLAAFAGRPPEGWLAAWQSLGKQATGIIDAAIDAAGRLNGPLLAREAWASVQGNLVLGSSNIIRDADLCGEPAPAPGARVFANRGLAGIDGTVATATGIAQARPGTRTTVLLGDITFLHDVGGMLQGAGEPEADLDVIVLNDRGGAIFSTLEHGSVHESGRYANTVERLFGTPHAVRLEQLAAAYGWQYAAAATTAEFSAVLAARGRGRRLVEVAVPRAGLRRVHAEITANTAALSWPGDAH